MMSGVADVPADRAEIAEIVRTYFAAFTSGPGCDERMAALRATFLPEAVIVRTGGGEPAVYDVDGFIAPRQAILTDGTLEEFHEWELSGHTELSATSPSTSAATRRRACSPAFRSRAAA